MTRDDKRFSDLTPRFPSAMGAHASTRSRSAFLDTSAETPVAGFEVVRGCGIGHNFAEVGVTRPIQTKLTISQPGDRYEQEADRVADAVMRAPESGAVGAPGSESAGLLSAGRTVIGAAVVQRQASETLSTAVAPGPTGDPATHTGPARAPIAPSHGQALPPSVRVPFEQRFGLDFSKVRIHTDSRAAESAQALRARAYTQGADIVFGAGQFRPQSGAGRHLLAHELTHVAQQSAGRPVPAIQRQVLPETPPIISPSLARMLGYLTLDGFALNSPVLTAAQRATLDGHAGTLRNLLSAYPGGLITLTGHTDATGTEEHNQELGQQRADAVKQVLIEQGLADDAISTTSAGESAPRVATSAAEVRNRRVQIEFRPVLPVTLGGPSLTLRLPPSALPVPPSRPVPDLRLPPDYPVSERPSVPPFLAPIPPAPIVTPRRPAVQVSPGGLIWLDIVVNPPGPQPVEASIARQFRERGISLSDAQLRALLNGRSEGIAQLEAIIGTLAPGLDAATRTRLAQSIADGLMGASLRSQLQRERPTLFEEEQARERRMEEMLGEERGRVVEGGLRLRVHF
jgi:outer membrane protein OmpA-like peptidoglycan-associated protein